MESERARAGRAVGVARLELDEAAMGGCSRMTDAWDVTAGYCSSFIEGTVESPHCLPRRPRGHAQRVSLPAIVRPGAPSGLRPTGRLRRSADATGPNPRRQLPDPRLRPPIRAAGSDSPPPDFPAAVGLHCRRRLRFGCRHRPPPDRPPRALPQLPKIGRRRS
ncbi:hypothetical protein ABZP36_008958 [Zizania latifolia]